MGRGFYGTVIAVRHGRECLLADAYRMPEGGDPIGPLRDQLSRRDES